MKKLMTYVEMAQRLGIAQGTLYSWVSRKRIPHVRFGPRCVRFDPIAVTEWLETHKAFPNPVQSLPIHQQSPVLLERGQRS